MHVTLHWPEPEQTRWQRLCRAVPLRVGPAVLFTSLAAAVLPIPGCDYGLGRLWGAALWQIDQATHYSVANVVGFGVVLLVGARIGQRNRIEIDLMGHRIRRLTWVDMLLVWITGIGGTWGVIAPDVVAWLTGVRS